jgi:hypothetical protein
MNRLAKSGENSGFVHELILVIVIGGFPKILFVFDRTPALNELLSIVTETIGVAPVFGEFLLNRLQ